MKYIKKFDMLHYDNENLDFRKYKFKIGDIVKLTPSKRKSLKSKYYIRYI